MPLCLCGTVFHPWPEVRKWPRCRFTNRSGVVEEGDVAYEDENEVVVRVEGKPKLVPSNYGLKEMTAIYATVQRKYVLEITA